MYSEQITSHSTNLPIRGCNYHARIWQHGHAANSGRKTLFLLHGWMDVAASWQFVVDAWAAHHPELLMQYRLVAPDWRGFGQSRPDGYADHYFYPDYFADLELLIAHFAPDQTVDLIGHSMGANIALMYAGIRPERIGKLVALEGFGLPQTQSEQAPDRYAQWLDQLGQARNGAIGIKPYASADDVAKRLIRNNPRITPDKAAWLAQHWAAPDAQDTWHIQADAAHKISNPVLYRAEEILAIYRRINAKVLAVEADANSLSLLWPGQYTLAEYHQRLTHIPHCKTAVVKDAGHMLHHDQPAETARLCAEFLTQC